MVLHEDAWSAAAHRLNIGFFSRMQRHRPWVRLKVAASMDGTTALANGRSQWITGEAARSDGHGFRRRAAAILTGIGTVREDDPRLDVRGHPIAHQPLRVVVDSRLEIDPAARILQPPGTCLVYASPPAIGAKAGLMQRLKAMGVEVAALPSETQGPSAGKNDLNAMLQDLGQRGINELHVEAGEKLNGSLLRSGCVDEGLLYLAPRLLGPGRGLASFAPEPLQALDEGLSLRWIEAQPVGEDLRLRALTTQGQAFWAQSGGLPGAH